MNSKLSDRKLLLIQEIQKLNKESSLTKIEKLMQEVRLADDIETLKEIVKRVERYQWQKKAPKIGTLISGVVVSHDIRFEKNREKLIAWGKIILKTNFNKFGIIHSHDMFGEGDAIDKTRVPKIGDKMEAMIKSHYEDHFQLSAIPADLSKENIESFQKIHAFIEKHEEGTILTGIVKEHRSFGLFVDLDCPFDGLVGVTEPYKFDSAKHLPKHFKEWPKIGTSIKVVIRAFNFQSKQISLYWIPE